MFYAALQEFACASFLCLYFKDLLASRGRPLCAADDDCLPRSRSKGMAYASGKVSMNYKHTRTTKPPKGDEGSTIKRSTQCYCGQ